MTLHRWIWAISTATAVGFAGLAAAQAPPDKAKLERGRYLVEEVGKCQECHTPRLENGEFDKEKWLKGAVLDFAPLKEVKGWHKTSPDITSAGRLFSRWGDEALMNYFKTGLGPKGTPADPPMPAYKLQLADAEAVVAYLKSLKQE
jgi:hypothetical protein